MGLFSSFSGKREKEIDLTDYEAVVFLAYLLYGKDGNFSGSEVNVFLGTVKKFFPNPDGFDPDIYFPHFGSLLLAHSKQDLIAHCVSSISADKYETLFVYLADGVLADGVLTSDEENTMEKLKESFKISDEKAAKIIEVMLIKNREF